MKPQDITKAWHSIKDRWFTRRNKEHNDGKQWEVIHDWGGEIVSDETMEVIKRFANIEMANAHAKKCENLARSTAVLNLIKRQRG